ncbi:endonuclease/exonuclease/phosphatase family protein [Vibrio marinisediminis]|uniref:endonuclease/exonuclease/phosphatase family protein n=1 Tax=Vibrio marinisediminis TaxID=2758441 RepID=UPI0034D2F989
MNVKPLIFLYVVALFAFPAQANQPLKVSTWNMEWFVSKGNKRFEPSLRSNADFYKMALYFRELQTPILAFQEVGDVDVIKRVIGDNYNVYFSDRASSQNTQWQYDNINQYTGFAVQKGIKVVDVADFSLLPSYRKDKLRFASYIIVQQNNSQPVHLLNVHLKARCSGRYTNSKACNTLAVQGKALNTWIQQREELGQSYIISGDFNHNLSFQNDWLWEKISQSTKARIATKNVEANCKVRSRNHPQRTHQFRSLIDHVVVSKDMTVISASQLLYRSEDVLDYRLSDHCPVMVTLTQP